MTSLPNDLASDLTNAGPAVAGALARYASVDESLVVVVCDGDGVIEGASRGVAAVLGEEFPAGEQLWPWLAEGDVESMQARFAQLAAGAPAGGDGTGDLDGEGFLLNVRNSALTAMVTLRCSLYLQDGRYIIVGREPLDRTSRYHEELVRVNNELSVLARENKRKQRELSRLATKLQEQAKELDDSHWHLRKVQEVLPICLHCGDVKPGTADWKPLAEFLREHGEFLSHGYCPDCLKTAVRDAEGSGLEDPR